MDIELLPLSRAVVLITAFIACGAQLPLQDRRAPIGPRLDYRHARRARDDEANQLSRTMAGF